MVASTPDLPKGWIETGAIISGLPADQALDLAHYVARGMRPVGLADGTVVPASEALIGQYRVTHKGWHNDRVYETSAVNGIVASAMINLVGSLPDRE